MTTLSSAGKMQRVLKFMLGLRDDRVLGLLQTRGFSASDREQGWDLLRGLGMTQSVPAVTAVPNVIETAVDRWRAEWMRIARVSLAQSFPRVHDQLFRPSKRKGAPLIELLSFLDQLEKLQTARDADSRAALAKLRARGLTSECIQQARSLVEQLQRPAPLPSGPSADQRRSAIKEAEDALWAYYIEWSEIARAVIKDRRLLELLGYGSDVTPDNEHPEPATISDPATAFTATKRIAKAATRPRPKARARKR